MEARRLILDLSSDVGELSGSEGAAVDAAQTLPSSNVSPAQTSRAVVTSEMPQAWRESVR